MKIAIMASEAAPYVKSGGLGDVMEALPSVLARMEGNQVVLLLPYYSTIKNRIQAEKVAQMTVQLGWRRQYAGIMKAPARDDGVQVYFIDNLYYFGNREGAIYGHGDDGERFAFFSKACLEALLTLGFLPDVMQCNDWQTAAVPVMLSAQYYSKFPGCKCMFTIHNIEYQGWADAGFFDDVLALPREYKKCLDLGGSVNLMKGAIETAHKVTTVSETYAGELMNAYFAHGLDGVLSAAAHKLTGITNGIDIRTFNPETDKALPASYNAKTFEKGKALCKAALQKEVGLPVKPHVPLLVMVTRLAGHKGLDLLTYIAWKLLSEQNCQLLILGTGEQRFEEFFAYLQTQFPEKFRVQLAFDLGLASRIYAGGDIYLMPSKSEPCGLSQMNAMRYGTVPVVHAVGGLRDTVPGVDMDGSNGLGFTFQTYNADDFYWAITRAIRLYESRPEAFRALQGLDMAQDFSWDKPAAKYMEIFKHM